MARSAPFAQSGVVTAPPASSFPNQILPLLTPASLTAGYIEQYPRRPYKQQWNLNIQRQLTNSLALTVGYVGSAGIHQARPLEDNSVVPPSLVRFDPGLDSFVFPVPAPGAKIQRINPNFGLIRSTLWNGQSNYHSLQANLVQRPVKGLSYQFAYTWSKSIDNGSTIFTEGNEAVNSSGTSWDLGPANINRGVSDWDIPHNFVANFQYDLPVPQAVKAHVLAKHPFRRMAVGWDLHQTKRQSFHPKARLRPSSHGKQLCDRNEWSGAAFVCECAGLFTERRHRQYRQLHHDPVLRLSSTGRAGNLGRHTLRMPVFRDLDFSVFKNQNVWGEKLKAQFRAEMFNILNNTNLQPQTLAIFDGSGNLIPNVGQPHSPTVNTSRQIQFGLRLLF